LVFKLLLHAIDKCNIMAKDSRATVFNPATFDDQLLTCSKCNWNGRGSETVIIDLYNVTDNREVRCPKCDNLLGILPVEKETPGDSGDQLGFQIG
jgi:hypothetical protein